jgi:hypothetical protein
MSMLQSEVGFVSGVGAGRRDTALLLRMKVRISCYWRDAGMYPGPTFSTL